MSKNNYIDNKRFYTELIKHLTEVKKKKDKGETPPRVPEYIGYSLWQISENLSHSHHFRSYKFREDMVSEGVLNCLQYLENFNPDKSSNPFAYYTQICLPQIARVETEDGQKSIKWIVDNQYQGKVLSLDDDGKLVWKKVIGWSALSNNAKKQWVVVKTSNSPSFSRLICTSDHRIAVIDNPMQPNVYFMPAEESVGKYSIRIPTDNKDGKLFNQEQLSVAIGTLLGDGSINKNDVFSITHGLKQEGYLQFKKGILGGTVHNTKNTNILRIPINGSIKFLRELLYQPTKTVKNILPYVNEMSLAFWYMDDGYMASPVPRKDILLSENGNKIGRPRTEQRNWIYLNTQGFSYEDHLAICEWFEQKWGITPFIESYVGKGFAKHPTKYNKLRFHVEDSEKIFAMISRYVPESMEYKLPEKFRGLEKHTFDNKPLAFAAKKVLEILPWKRTSKLYDISVEDTECFFANKSLVHNCYYAFLRRIQKEKAYLYTKYKTIENTEIFDGTADYSGMEDMGNNQTVGYSENARENMMDFIEKFETNLEKKKKKTIKNE